MHLETAFVIPRILLLDKYANWSSYCLVYLESIYSYYHWLAFALVRTFGAIDVGGFGVAWIVFSTRTCL